MKKAYLALACVLLAPMLLVSVSSSATYDPWVDLDDNGTINIFDVVTLANSYQTTGDPTKNVNVLNWPVETQTFPENLVLKTTSFSAAADPDIRRNDLIEYAEPYLNGSEDIRNYFPYLTTTPVTIVDETFVYQRMPMKPYLVAGLLSMSLPFTIRTDSASYFYLELSVFLGTVGFDGQYTELGQAGYVRWYFSGIFTDFLFHMTLGSITPVFIQVGAYERLAIRIIVSGYAASGWSTWSTLCMLQGSQGHDAYINIPIVEDF